MGLPIAVLTLVVVVAVVVAGGDDDEEQVTATQATPAETPAIEPPPRERQESSRERNKAGRERGDRPGEGGSSPPSPLEGTPVGRVPANGGLAADQEAVARVVRAYHQAIVRGEGGQACAQFTPEGERAMERRLARIAPETKGSPCGASILLYQSSYGQASGSQISDVRVAGTRATAVGPTDELAELEKRGNLWLIASYGE